ncbi:hypothetical protein EY643_06650 [Halioglobus maricola]|uniref:Uncharacterized protein n=1 Tax=Halioglobus maricola TaxID=2601894 RepID=A0A5P9NII7_9GAMM|nr:hypothetical protein [Halioglobus maricola]QFU75355.1 hypothetical protein EY643_06650 [Halioglobus maricola]
MASVAIPRNPRPHQPLDKKNGQDGRKQRLIERIARGDLHGAESVRQEIRDEYAARVTKTAPVESANGELSFVSWRNSEGEIETLEMTATREAKAYFKEVMAKERFY